MYENIFVNMIKAQIPRVYAPLFQPYRYKLFYGGRGGAKSWAFASVLLILALKEPIRILCCREFQNSTRQSVHQLLIEQIDHLNLSAFFDVQQQKIKGINGSEFIFMGLARNIQGIKSTENISIAWVEEAQTISQSSLDLLIPTIRAPRSELWFSWNPLQEDAPIEQLRSRLIDDNEAVVKKVGWQDNPWFPDELDAERRRLLVYDPAAYEHVWEGSFQTRSDALVFNERVVVQDFETPDHTRFYYGVDWGFAKDPTALIRCFILNHQLYVDYEIFGESIEIDALPNMFDQIPDIRRWPIRADSARPETISYLARQGFNIRGAKKWAGSIEDGLAYLKSFRQIVVHPRCPKIAQEFRRYAYQVDRLTLDILPKVEDANNHGIDALRYALDGLITHKARAPVFTKTALKQLGAR